MLGCVLLAIEMVLVVIAPPIGIPLVLLTLVAMLVIGAARGAMTIGRTAAPLDEPQPPVATPERCPVCSYPITDPAQSLVFRGATYHRSCWRG